MYNLVHESETQRYLTTYIFAIESLHCEDAAARLK